MSLKYLRERMQKIARGEGPDPVGGWEFDKWDNPASAVSNGPATVGAKPSNAKLVARPTGTPPPIPLGHQKTMVGTPAVKPRAATLPGPAPAPAVGTASKLAPLKPGSGVGTPPPLPNKAVPAVAKGSATGSLVRGWQHTGGMLAKGKAPGFWARPGAALQTLKTPGRALTSRLGSAARMVAPHAGLIGAGLLGARALFGQKQAMVKAGGVLLMERTASFYR